MDDIATTTLTAPLDGGRDGATVTVRPLLTGELAVPPGFLHREPRFAAKARVMIDNLTGKDRAWVPAPVFFVEHPTAGKMLIDTGLAPAVALSPRAAMGRFGALIYKFRMDAHQSAPHLLRELGIAPAEIATVVMTHLHYDHAGAVAEFPQAVFVVAKNEWRSAFGRKLMLRGYVKRQYAHAFDFRLVDYDARSINSFASFGRAFDLLGDGSIMLVSTPGHTHGHQSVILRTAGGELLICGDAAYTSRTIDESLLPLVTADEHQFRRSLREIRSYIDMTPNTTVIPGHDAERWKALKELYA